MAVTLGTKEVVKAPEAPVTIVLELAIYTRYWRSANRRLYDNEHAYRFTEEQARILLAEKEEDTGRFIWKRYKPKPTAASLQPVPEGHKAIIETADSITEITRPDADIDQLGSIPKRLDIGSDDELREAGIELDSVPV